VVGGRADTLAQPQVGDKAEITTRCAHAPVLRIEQRLKKGHEISSHLATMIATPLASFRELAVSGVRRLSDA
jgi:hypothetical protein